MAGEDPAAKAACVLVARGGGEATQGVTPHGGKRRASCNSSRYFDATPAWRISPGGGWLREARSEYFSSSADSCAGSAKSFDWGSAFTPEAFVALKACDQFEEFGVRHLCRNKCYFRAYEPFRKWHALRLKVAEAGSSTRVLTGWSVQMDRGQRAEQPCWRIKYVSPDVSTHKTDAGQRCLTRVSDFAAIEVVKSSWPVKLWDRSRLAWNTSSHVSTSAKRMLPKAVRVFHQCTALHPISSLTTARVPSNTRERNTLPRSLLWRPWAWDGTRKSVLRCLQQCAEERLPSQASGNKNPLPVEQGTTQTGRRICSRNRALERFQHLRLG